MEGELIGGRYRLGAPLGKGGMGVVHAATDARTGAAVALKLLVSQGGDDPASRAERFKREARVTLAASTPHIVRVHEAGVDATTGVAFIVMDLLVGEDAAQLIERLVTLEPVAAVRIAAQACRGLVEAHAHGVVHRDIKPANLFLARGESDEITVKLLDFGVAKESTEATAATTPSLTASGDIIGSLLYMSPEQVLAPRSTDARTDLWSLGVVLYELLCGRPPLLLSGSSARLALELTEKPPVPIETVAPWVPPPIATILERALRIDRDARYPTAAAMLADLLAAAGGDARLTTGLLRRQVGGVAAPRHSGLSRTLDAPVRSDRPAISPLAHTESAPVTGGTIAMARASARAPLNPVDGGAPPVGAGSRAPRPGATAITLAVALLALALVLVLVDPFASLARQAAPSPPPLPVVIVSVRIKPPSARVEVDGDKVRVDGDRVGVRGVLDSEHEVRVYCEMGTRAARVRITESGATPEVIDCEGR